MMAAVAVCLMACSEHDALTDAARQGEGTPIIVGSTYPTAQTTRAAIDGGFSVGDEMGVFVVDYDADGQPGTVALQGNRASNMRFTLQDDGTWLAATQLYWDTSGKSADFYGYYPFDGYLSSVTAYPFSVAQRQEAAATSTKAAGYVGSDLLWASAKKISPTTETVNLRYNHILSGVTIRLEQGTGFTATEWESLEKMVLIENTVTDGTVDLTTGTPTVGSGAAKNIVPLPYGGQWRAITYPQTVAAGKTLVSVTIDGQTYSLTKSEVMTYVSGKMHQFTITVNRRTPSGDLEFVFSDEAITPWQDDADMHEGLVREYVVVELTEAGTLASTLAARGIDPAELLAVKIVGPVNEDDYKTINLMTKLTHLNLIKAVPEDGRLTVIDGIPIEKVYFPEQNLKVIDAFNNCLHLTGSLIIPEGVEEAGGFWGCNFTGSLTLPSTLKKVTLIKDPFKGDLAIPEGLEEWGAGGFGNKGRITGTMFLPSTLKLISATLPDGMTGTINIPQGCEITCDGAFQGSQCTALIIPEGITTIPHRTFEDSEIRGEVRIPSTVTHIVSYAFANTKMSRLILPDGLKNAEEYAFAGNSRLQGTVVIPKKLTRISEGLFEDCPMLTGVVFHKDVAVIDRNAFARCNNLNSIVCEGEEPPFVVDDAFLGVPKDNFTLEVPKGCVDKYRNARGWGDFKRISEYSNFVCRPAQAQALNNGHSEELVLNADGDWTVQSQPSWVTLSKTNGTGKTALTLTFQPLTHSAGNRTGEIVFQMQQGAKSYTTSCKVSQYDYDYDEDYSLTLQQHSKGRGINIVFVGDGYDGESMADGSYLDLVKYQTECFFAIEPYKSMRDYFNVYVTFPLSQEKGVNTMYTYVNNRFGTLNGMSSLVSGSQACSTSNQLITESDEVVNYVVEKTPVAEGDLWRTLVILVPNSSDYEGNTQYDNNSCALCICPPSEQAYPRDTRGVIQHEAGGHGFGKLGDENISMNAFAPASVRSDIEDMHGRGWFANLATTGKLSSVPWAEYIFDPDYSDYVDVYEGGYGYTRSIYRPEANSCMNYGIPYYNTPSREAIYRRILDYAGESYSNEAFRAQDTFAWGSTDITRATQVMPTVPYVDGNHAAPRIVDGRAIGNKVRQVRATLKKERDRN